MKKRPDDPGPARAAPGRLRPPLHPYVVLAVALVLPGAGQVLNNMVTRGLMMVMFMLTLGMVSYHLTTPAHSFLGRHAGGIFIYAIAVMDAYRWARYRWTVFHQARADAPASRNVPQRNQ